MTSTLQPIYYATGPQPHVHLSTSELLEFLNNAALSSIYMALLMDCVDSERRIKVRYPLVENFSYVLT